MKSKLLKSIKKVEETRETEMDLLRKQYAYKLSKLIKQCNHIDDDGINALAPAGHPFHSGWDVCKICGKYIETNSYGRLGASE